MKNIRERFEEGGVLFDGAIGTMLIAKGLRLGRPPEEWNRDHPDIVRDIHLAYLDAGAEVITANTFGGTPSRLASYRLGDRIDEINRAGVALAGQAIAEFGSLSDSAAVGRPASQAGAVASPAQKRFVALSVGPTGRMFPPVGDADEGRLRDEFTVQLSGVPLGYDLVLIETMYDLREALIALGVATSLVKTPVAVTLTFNENPRGFFTIMGDEAGRAVKSLEDAGADVVGANCTITSAEMVALAKLLRDSVDLPILCQPNAGQPRVRDGLPSYEQAPQDFARNALELFAIGVNAVGGCCGSTPAFIRELSTRMRAH